MDRSRTIPQRPCRAFARNAQGVVFPAARKGLTLVELLVVVGIVSLLSTIALSRLHHAALRAKVAAAMDHLRQTAAGLDQFRADYGWYPEGDSPGPEDPLGILAGTALTMLTTPIPYVSGEAFRDQFGPTRQVGTDRDPIDPRFPSVNPDQYLLYFAYPKLARVRLDPRLNVDGFAVVSIGPDKMDSMIAYYPFPESLPPVARRLGIYRAEDTVYDPSNGVASTGDLARYGGEAQRRGCCAGGGQ